MRILLFSSCLHFKKEFLVGIEIFKIYKKMIFNLKTLEIGGFVYCSDLCPVKVVILNCARANIRLDLRGRSKSFFMNF